MNKLLCCCLLFLFACQSESTYENHQLIGKWEAIEWKDLTNNKTIDIKVDFTFDENLRYVGNYGDAAEKGKYWIEGDNLHTIEDGKAEKKVKITKLQNDTLIFGMNRAGTEEQITLVKK